jgi:hypothetical protein
MQKPEDGSIWRKSSFCNNATCLEIAISSESEGIFIRDSRNLGGPILHVSHDDWRAFVKGVQNREFDVP